MTRGIVIEQAVILCGGLGTRLRPLTDSLPKAMVSVNDQPFLYHLLKQLSEKGITRFVLLTGYLSGKISDYFGDGSQYGWTISYSTGPTDWETGRRVWEARGELDERFLLLYSDNFIQFNLTKLKKLHQNLTPALSLLLAPKSKGNIKVSEDGRIQAYDKTRSGDGFDFVEVGYMLVERDAILTAFANQLTCPDFSFSEILQRLAQQQKMAGLVVRDAYHSISDPVRLVLMSNYLKPKKILLIDRDGTMNEKAPSGDYIINKDQFKWIPETLDALQELSKLGFKFIVITNQAGIARKIIEPDALEDIHKKLISDLACVGVEILQVYTCPDHWGVNSLMRKPAPGMFFQAAREFNLRMDRCLYVGDDERDCMAAANAGCGMVYLSGSDVPPKLDEFPETFFVSTGLKGAVSHIKDSYCSWDVKV